MRLDCNDTNAGAAEFGDDWKDSHDRDIYEKLSNACGFDWEKISPAAFGSLVQSVMDGKERRRRGAHYTSAKNILKVIEPLFLDELRAEFSRLKARKDRGRKKALEDFHEKIGRLAFLDPACGCGDFLVVAYRELRELEIALLKELHPGAQRVIDVGLYRKVDVGRFHGIEISEFPARVAKVAMSMMDHVMNMRLAAAFGGSRSRMPSGASPNIRCADALETEWANALAPEECSFILGNPPFRGQSYQSVRQRDQMRRVVGARNGRAGSLDYVCAWFIKAGEYVRRCERDGPGPRIGFVATNSITQGEQVAQLWPLLFERYGLEIAFAHRPFEWMSEAEGKAHVHCVVVGLVRREDEPEQKRLFSYDTKGEAKESRHAALSPYLFDAGGLANRRLVVRDSKRPLSDMPPLRMGSKIVDDGNYIFTEEERAEFLAQEPNAQAFLRPLIGSKEFINGGRRWILCLHGVDPSVVRSMPGVRDRVAAVRAFRKASAKRKTRELGDDPTRFEVATIPTRPFLAIPETSSERREYVPVGWLRPPTITNNSVQVMLDAELWRFALVTSRMHMAWLRNIGGRLESRYRYSIEIVYNTFPWPDVDGAAEARLSALAQAVLDARAAHPGAGLADLYDPDLMPPDLREAHHALDEAVDLLYRRRPFSSDRERVECLLGLYEELVSPALFAVRPKPRRRVSG